MECKNQNKIICPHLSVHCPLTTVHSFLTTNTIANSNEDRQSALSVDDGIDEGAVEFYAVVFDLLGGGAFGDHCYRRDRRGAGARVVKLDEGLLDRLVDEEVALR